MNWADDVLESTVPLWAVLLALLGALVVWIGMELRRDRSGK